MDFRNFLGFPKVDKAMVNVAYFVHPKRAVLERIQT